MISLRAYATAAKRIVEHSHCDLHNWPKAKKPSPYEIFNIIENDPKYSNRVQFDNSVKGTYQKFVKIYHPDVFNHVDVLDNGGSILLDTQRRNRFDLIQDAYDILKDPKKRLAYRKYETTDWLNYRPGQTGSFDAYRMANAHRRKYSYTNDQEFWQAGTWEDYYKMKHGRPAPTHEEWEKNKWKILYKVLAAASVVVVIQIILALERTEDFNRQTRLRNLRANADLARTYLNYDEGLSELLRVRRFLLYRRLGLSDREKDLEETELLQRYAQQRVKRWSDETPPLPVGSEFLSIKSNPLPVGSEFLSIKSNPLPIGSEFLSIGSDPRPSGSEFLSIDSDPRPSGSEFLLIGPMESTGNFILKSTGESTSGDSHW